MDKVRSLVVATRKDKIRSLVATMTDKTEFKSCTRPAAGDIISLSVSYSLYSLYRRSKVSSSERACFKHPPQHHHVAVVLHRITHARRAERIVSGRHNFWLLSQRSPSLGRARRGLRKMLGHLRSSFSFGSSKETTSRCMLAYCGHGMHAF